MAVIGIVLLVAACQSPSSPTAQTPPATATAQPTSTAMPVSPTPVLTASPSPLATSQPALPAQQPTVGVPTLSSPVPPEIEQAVRAEAARLASVDPGSVEVQRAEAVDWPDTSLGCPRPGQMYAQVITPGYRVTVVAGGKTYEIHTDRQGRAVICE